MTARMRRVPPSLRWCSLVLLLAAFAVYPALRYNIGALAHDAARSHIYRAFVYSDAVSQRVLYPRWVQFLHLGLGSPLFTFHPPLAYGALDLLHRVGLPHPIGWRVLMAAGLLAACAGAYLLVSELAGRRWAGLLAGVAFLYAPYVLRNAFERGSVEAFGVFLYPWVLWGLLRLARYPTGWRFLLAAGIWSACIATHVLAPLMLAPLALLVALVLARRHHTASPVLALLAGVLLTAFIWAPMLAEQRWVHVERDFQQVYASPGRNPLALDRLLALPAVYDVLRDDNSTGDRVGLWHVFWLIAGIPATACAWRRGDRHLAWIIGLAAATGLILFWLLTSASDPVWTLLAPILTRLQYRFRWMGLQALAAAVVAGGCVALLPRRWQPTVSMLLAAGLILTALPSLSVSLQHRYAPFETTISPEEVRRAEIASGGTAFTYFGEFMPRWRTLPLDQAFAEQLGATFDPQSRPLAEPATGVQIHSARVRPGAWDLALRADRSQTITLHLLYYPRWRALVDGQPAELRPQQDTGYAQLDVPAGVHRVTVRYGTTVEEAVGWAASLLTLLAVLVTIARSRLAHRSRLQTAPGDIADAASPARRQIENAAPPGWLLAILTAALAIKVFYVDDHTTWLRCVSTPARVCGVQATVDVPFEEGPRLRGYSVIDTVIRPGGTARINLVWQGEPGQTRRLVSFVHIRNSQPGLPTNPRTASEIWAQEDHETPAGLLVTEFLPGRLYMDKFRVPIPSDIPAGTYFVEIGWADPETGEQLDPQTDSVKPPLGVLWRSLLLPPVEVR